LGITNISPRAMGSRSNILAMPVLILTFISILAFPFSQASITLKARERYLVRTSAAGHSAKGPWMLRGSWEKEKGNGLNTDSKGEKKKISPKLEIQGRHWRKPVWHG